MFTTIAKLRASNAMQSRVTQVFTALKKRSPGATETTIFPIEFIMVSNGPSDTSWVKQSPSTHVKPAGWTAAVQKMWDMSSKPNPSNKATAEAWLKTLGEFLTAKKIAVLFYAPQATTPAAEVAAPAKKVAATRPVPVKKAAPVKKVASKTALDPAKPMWPFPTNPEPQPAAKTVAPGFQAKAPVKPVVKAKPLPVPSVLKQIRDLVKGHPKIKLHEAKGVPGHSDGSTLTLTY